MTLPMLSAFMIFNFSLNEVEQLTSETNRAYLQLMVQAMESAVEGTNQIMDSLMVNSDFAFISRIGETKSTAQRYQLLEFSRNVLRHLVPSDPFILRKYVYLENSRLLLDGYTYQSLERSYSGYLDGISISYDEYVELLDNSPDLKYLPVELGPTKTVLCIRSLPAVGRQLSSKILVFISQQAVLDVLAEADWNRDGIICVLDQQGTLLMTNDEAALEGTSLYQVQNNSTVDINGSKYLCMSSQSVNSGLTYLSFVPYDLIYQRAGLLRSLSAVAIISGMLAGIMLALAMTQRNYRPVKRIMSKLNSPGTSGDEYEYILSSIERGQLVQDTLKNQLAEKQRMLGREQLARLLTGRMTWGLGTPSLLEGYHISLNSAQYVVAICGAVEFYADMGRNIMLNTAELISSMLKNEFEGLSLYSTDEDMNIVLLIGMDSDISARLADYLKSVGSELHDVYDISAELGMSGVAADPANLPELYRQAAAALDYAQMHSDSPVVCYPAQNAGGPYIYSIEQEMLIIQAVQSGRDDEAMQVLDGVMAKFYGRIDVWLAQCLRIDLIATCMRIFAYADSVMTRDMWQGEGVARQLLDTSSMTELYEQIKSVLPRLCAAMRDWKNRSHANLSGQICRFVEENWSRQELSVAMIAGQMDMHPSYVSRLFKEEQGVGLLEYINRYRIEQAVALLCGSELSVSAIAQQCGYTSDASFIRVFKQYRGMTPGNFRDECRKK